MSKGYKRIYKFDRIQQNQALSSVLRHQVDFQYKANTNDGEGGRLEGWISRGVTWASVDPITAKQRNYYNSLSTEVTHIVKIRGDVICSDTDRLVFGERIFEILTIENIQERDILKMVTCNERSR